VVCEKTLDAIRPVVSVERPREGQSSLLKGTVIVRIRQNQAKKLRTGRLLFLPFAAFLIGFVAVIDPSGD